MDSILAPLKGKVALVTGGSRGIGAGIAQKLAEQGCSHIAITYSSNKSKAEDVLSGIQKLSPSIKTHAFAANLLEDGFGEKSVKETLSGLSTDHIDIVVCNAAHVDSDAMALTAKDIRKSEWNDVLTGNAWAPLDLARNAITVMPPGGRMINISSVASRMASGENSITYSASKAALDSITRNLAASWGTQYGVTVNSISVGATLTDALEKAIKNWGEDFEKLAKNSSLLKRVGEVREVANIVAFVASPEASWVVGSSIPANGGTLPALQG